MEDVDEAVGIKHVVGDFGREPVVVPKGIPRSFIPDKHSRFGVYQRGPRGLVRLDVNCPLVDLISVLFRF